MKAVIVGSGNPLYGDDGYGSLLARSISKCSGDIDVVDAGQSLLGIMGLLSDYDLVVFVDVCSQELLPDEDVGVLRIAVEKIDSGLMSGMLREIGDAHSMTPVHLTALLYSTGSFSGKAYLVCVRPYSLSFGKGLSEKIIENTPKVLEAISKIMVEEGVGLTINGECVVSELERASMIP